MERAEIDDKYTRCGPFFLPSPGENVCKNQGSSFACAKIKGVPSQIGFRFQNDLSGVNFEGI